jgi:hypothetical protein
MTKALDRCFNKARRKEGKEEGELDRNPYPNKVLKNKKLKIEFHTNIFI